MKGLVSLVRMFISLFVARPGSGVIIVLGVAGLTAIVVSLFVMASSFEKALMTTGKADRALVLRAGSTSEINGNVPLAQFPIVRELPQVRRAGDIGMASRETYVTVKLPTHDGDGEGTLPLRGVTEDAFTVRPEVKIVSGTNFSPGKYELLVGVKAAQTFADLAVGETIWVRGQRYLVSGHFTASASATETELWMDERLLAQTLGRGSTFSSILVQLQGDELFEQFQQKLAEDKRLTVAAYRESDFYSDLAEPTAGLIKGIGVLVGVIMALGAIAAAMNSMQSALQSRTREIATLRALGFGRPAVLAAVLIECTLLSLVGASLALAGVYLLLDGSTLSTVAAATSSGAQVAFQFSVTKDAAMFAGAIAVGLGILGGLIPGLGATRKSLPQALRA